MIPKEIFKKVKNIEIRTRNIVTEMFSGEYHSVFKGQGIEFSEVRAYQVGDSIRQIDWNVSARMGHPYIKKFEETRELTVMLIIDVSGSGAFGTINKLKQQLAVELAAVLAFSAIKNNDKVGLLLFTNVIEKFIPPKKGRKAVLRIIREMLYYKPENKGTDINNALKYYYQMTKRKSIVFVISDFLNKGYNKTLKIIAQKHDVIGIRVIDPKEENIPSIGLVNFVDAETGKEILINTNDKAIQVKLAELRGKERDEIAKEFKRMKIDLIEINTAEDYTNNLIKFFRMRERRIRH